MELITGTAKTPHVTSTQHRSIYEMIIGEGSYILGKGELLEPELQSNNVLRIRSGMLYHHGSISEVKQNTYDEVNIGNGSQGMKRIDLVVARYTKNPETEIETMTWEVIQGTPAADSPVAPAYTEGNMQDGDLTDDCPLFEVHLDGIQVTEVVKLLEVLNGSLAELNSKTKSTILEGSNAYRIISSNINTEQSNAVMRRVGNIRIFSFEFTAKSTVSSDITPYVLNNDDAPASHVDFSFKSGSSIKHGWIFSGSTTVYTDSGIMTSGQASNGEIIYTV